MHWKLHRARIKRPSAIHALFRSNYMAVGGKYLLRCKFHRDVSSGTNEAGGNGRAANGVGPAPGENFGSGGENYRKTNPSVRYLYEVRENFNRVCVCRTRVCVSWIRKRDA